MAERPIVVGVDGTTTALRAVAWAAEEAVLRQLPLRLVHAAPYLGTPDDPGPARGRAGAVLARARSVAHQIAPKVSTEVVVTPDPPVSVLVDASADAELLVIGMIGGSGAEIVLGSVTLDVTTGAHCPVTVVRGDRAASHPAPTAPVLLGIESVGADAAAVTLAFEDAARHGTGIVVVHVAGHSEDPADSVAAVRERLRAVAVRPSRRRRDHPDRAGQPRSRGAARIHRRPTHHGGQQGPSRRGACRTRFGEPLRAAPQPGPGHRRPADVVSRSREQRRGRARR